MGLLKSLLGTGMSIFPISAFKELLEIGRIISVQSWSRNSMQPFMKNLKELTLHSSETKKNPTP